MRQTTPTTAPIPAALRIPAASAWSGLSRSALYRAAGEGRLRLIKAGRSTLVDTASLAALLASLPTANIRRHGA